MQVTVENKGTLERQMNITVPAAEVDNFFSQRYDTMSKQVKVQGFRPGKVPVNIIRQRYAKQVSEEAAQAIINQTMPKAFEEQKVAPAGQPHVHSHAAEEGKDYAYHVHFEILPEVTPKNYTKLKLSRQVADANEASVEDAVKRMLKAQATYKEKTGALAKEDRATIDTKGYVNGAKEVYPGTDLSNHQVIIGSNQLISGFEEELIGLKTGDEKSFDITFPKEYHSKELAGQKTTFEVKITKVESPQIPELNDDFAKQIGTETVADLKAKIKERMAEELQNTSDQLIKKDLFDKLVKENSFEVPKSLIDGEFESIWNAQMQNMARQGVSPENLGQNADEMRAEFRTLAERRVRLGLLLAEIARKHEIDVPEEEISAEIDRMAEQYGDKKAEAKAYLSQSENRNQVYGPLFEKKVVDWLLKESTIEDKKVKAKELLEQA